MSAPALDVVDPVAAHAALLGRYFHYHLDVMPAAYGSMDTNRVTLAYFALAGLDLLHQLQPFLDADNRRQSLIDWIYAHQVLPAADGDGRRCGFRGSTANCVSRPFALTPALSLRSMLTLALSIVALIDRVAVRNVQW